MISHKRRIIPARAGSRSSTSRIHCLRKDHPRARGEQIVLLPSSLTMMGSSPRARGADRSTKSQRLDLRIIPARAGSSVYLGMRDDQGRDHPRARGEQLLRCFICGASRGSSPRARGAEAEGVGLIKCFGIIPARAGSRSYELTPITTSRDHPRARGEQSRRECAGVAKRGSSPRARGAVENEAHDHTCKGIIPARAGSSAKPCGDIPSLRDHPRARGEQLCSQLFLQV